MKNFLLSFLIVLAAFAAGRYLFPVAETSSGLTEVVARETLPSPDVSSLPAARLTREEAEGYTPDELHTIRLFENASPSVCYITTKALRRDFWSYRTQEVESGSGSGFVWDKEGHIITNYHVVNNRPSAIVVTLANGDSYQAEVVGFAKEKDLAVLRIDAPAAALRPIPVGTSQNIRVGQSVYAIGNPFGLDQTLTTGVVSALDREIMSQARIPIRGAIQTDAAINPGNSGGPLLDSDGRLIGVNTAIYSPSGASAGIGFSIPVDIVRYVVPDLIRYGEVRMASIGADLRPNSRVKGLIVFQPFPGSSAERVGLRGLSRDTRGRLVLGDIVVGINDNDVFTTADLYLELERYQPGDVVEVNIIRDERPARLRIELGSSLD